MNYPKRLVEAAGLVIVESPDPARLPPVLLYHKIDPRREWGVTNVVPPHFERQMKLIAQHDKHSVPLELLSANNTSQIGITFDDGYDSIYTYAYPIMQPLEFTGTIFLLSDFIGKSNRWEARLGWRTFQHLDESQIRELIRAGWCIGSHGKSHIAFTLLSNREAQSELAQSKDRLEQQFGVEISSFAFPFGRYRPEHLEMAIQTGYRFLCLPRLPQGHTHLAENLLTRRAVYSFESDATFIEKVTCNTLPCFHQSKLEWANRLAGGTVMVQRMRRII